MKPSETPQQSNETYPKPIKLFLVSSISKVFHRIFSGLQESFTKVYIYLSWVFEEFLKAAVKFLRASEVLGSLREELESSLGLSRCIRRNSKGMLTEISDATLVEIRDGIVRIFLRIVEGISEEMWELLEAFLKEFL